MEIMTRLMEPGEAPEVLKIARRAFSGAEALFVSKPKQAMVAVSGEKIVGAIQYKFYSAGGKKIGYYDYAFISPDYHNQGIGNILYKAVADYLLGQGCVALTALVKDDNPGSWSLFLKHGFTRISLPEMVRQFGLFGTLKLYLGSVYGIAVGMDYYVALPDQECLPGKGGSEKQIAAYVLVNLLLPLCLLFQKSVNFGMFFTAYAIFIFGGIFAGYIGTLLSKRKWHFRLCNGGGLICMLVNLLGNVFPMVGNWYPVTYENTGSFRRDMGIQALTGWLFVLVLSALSLVTDSQHLLIAYLSQIGSALLLYRVLAVYPFESFGGGRVYRWHKGIYVMMAAVSLAVSFWG